MFSKQQPAALKNQKYRKELLGLFTLLSAFTVLYSVLIFLVYPYTVKEIKKKKKVVSINSEVGNINKICYRHRRTPHPYLGYISVCVP